MPRELYVLKIPTYKGETKMPYMEKEVSKEIYDNAQKHNGYMTKEDEKKVFDVCELCGYGIYGARVYARDGKYYCTYYRGNSCD